MGQALTQGYQLDHIILHFETLSMLDYPIFSLSLSTWIFLSSRYGFKFFFIDAFFMLKSYGWWWGIGLRDLSDSPNFPFPIGFDY